MSASQIERLSTIVALIERAPGKGRTAIMKYCYFLQALRRVPLGYDFTLYSYGPFDSDVLGDLATCEAMGGIIEQVVEYPRSYGYRLTLGSKAEEIKGLSPEFVKQHQANIEWVVGQFGECNAAELELISTVIYADRDLKQTTRDELVRVVRGIKPHFTAEVVSRHVEKLVEAGLLRSLTRAAG